MVAGQSRLQSRGRILMSSTTKMAFAIDDRNEISDFIAEHEKFSSTISSD